MSKIKATVKGNGFPVVFIHGFCETKAMWQPYTHSLTSQYQVICIDLPGFGESPLIEASFGLEEIADEVVLFLKGMDIHHAVFLGHSLGGYVSLAIAERHPDIIKGLGLLNSTAFADDEEAKHKRNKALLFLKKHDATKFVEPFIPTLFFSKRKDELSSEIQKAIKIGLTSSKATIVAYTLAMKNRKDRFNIWKEISPQCLFIGGANDSRILIDVSERHIEERPKTDGYILPETAHMAISERPSETLQMIKDYLLKVV